MVLLEDVLLPSAIVHAKEIIIVQDLMMSISEDKVQEAKNTILNLSLIHTSDGILSLSNNAYFAVLYRPNLIHPLSKLIISLCNSSNDENKLSELKEKFLDLPQKILEQKWKIALLHSLYYHGLYSDDELFEVLNNFLEKHPIISNLPFWKNGCRQQYLIFIWFAPLLFKKSPKVFDNIFNHLKESVSKRDLTDNYNNYLELFPKLMENDWEIYKEWSHDLYLKDSLAYIIKNDDVEELKKIPSLSPNDRILPTVFEFSLFLSRKPNLFHFSAFYGSEKCFNYLVTLGGDMKAQDYGKRNLIHFALFGGNMNIIQRSVKEISNYDLVTRLAAEFHRFDLFKLFCETNKTDIKSNDLENGSIFHGIAASNHIKMILYCIEQNCDVNLRDGDGWAPLNCAIDYCALDAIHVLLAHKDIDVNMQDEYGISPLIRATINGNADVVEILLKHPKIEINAYGLYNQTALHRAVQSNAIDVIKVLLSVKEIDVNLVDHQNRTPLHFAVQNRSKEAVNLLLSNPNIDKSVVDDGLLQSILNE